MRTGAVGSSITVSFINISHASPTPSFAAWSFAADQAMKFLENVLVLKFMDTSLGNVHLKEKGLVQ